MQISSTQREELSKLLPDDKEHIVTIWEAPISVTWEEITAFIADQLPGKRDKNVRVQMLHWKGVNPPMSWRPVEVTFIPCRAIVG